MKELDAGKLDGLAGCLLARLGRTHLHASSTPTAVVTMLRTPPTRPPRILASSLWKLRDFVSVASTFAG
jgi:hypothetical protein